MTIDYRVQADESLRKVERAVKAIDLDDVELARRLEALARRIRRHNKLRSDPPTIGKYGRMCTANRKLYRSDVNYLYWEAELPVANIARYLGISQPSVAKLIEREKG